MSSRTRDTARCRDSREAELSASGHRSISGPAERKRVVEEGRPLPTLADSQCRGTSVDSSMTSQGLPVVASRSVRPKVSMSASDSGNVA
jgi:hypothetical protein